MLDILRKRRSIRKYRDLEIDRETIELLKEAALRAPTSRGIKPWRFVFVTDKALLEKLSKTKKSGSGFLKGASLGVVVCADENESDVWIEDCSIASIILQLAGLSLGLGSCWIQIRNRETGDGTSSEAYVRGLLKIPRHLRIGSIVAIGHPAEKNIPIPLKKLCFKKIRFNGF